MATAVRVVISRLGGTADHESSDSAESNLRERVSHLNLQKRGEIPAGLTS
jgi:hypothetical protein